MNHEYPTPPTEDATVKTVDEHLSISKDDLFHLLQNARRRAVLRYFAAHPEQDEFNMRTVAEAIAAWENETTVEQLTSDQRQRVYIALYQSHLPKLDDYEVSEYNQLRGLIVPTPLTVLFERTSTRNSTPPQSISESPFPPTGRPWLLRGSVVSQPLIGPFSGCYDSNLSVCTESPIRE